MSRTTRLHFLGSSVRIGNAGINALAKLQSNQPFYIGGVHQSTRQIAMIRITTSVDCDRFIEMLQRLCVFTGAPDNATTRRLDVSQCQPII